MAIQISLGEVLRVGRVKVEHLLHVEELYAVVHSLGSDDKKISNDADLSPIGPNAVILRQASQIDQLSLVGDLGKSGAIVLSEGNDLSAVRRSPAPRRRPASTPASKISVR